MKKRFVALALLFALVFALHPSNAAQAAVLQGPTSKVDYDNTDPQRYYLDFDLVNQIVTVYEGGPTGTVVLQSLCSSGSEKTPSGSGVYRLGAMKERFGYFVAFGQYAQYWTQIVRGVYAHSVMYDSTKLSSMSRAAYNDLGKAVSHGCIRLLPHVAQWIFYNCPPGTTARLNVKAAPNPGLVKELKSSIVPYKEYKQPQDTKPYPVEIPSVVLTNNVPLRTGFSASKDETLLTLNAGDRVMLLQLASDWCKVRVLPGGKLGYVKTQYLLFSPDEAPATRQGYAATGKTYLYEKTDTGSKRLATFAKGTEVTVTGSVNGSWYTASVDGLKGFVRTKYVALGNVLAFPTLPGAPVQPLPPALGTQQPAPAAPVATGGPRILDGITANLRAAPNGDILAILDGNTPVTVLSAEGSWYYCEANGIKGYLHTSCLYMG